MRCDGHRAPSRPGRDRPRRHGADLPVVQGCQTLPQQVPVRLVGSRPRRAQPARLTRVLGRQADLEPRPADHVAEIHRYALLQAVAAGQEDRACHRKRHRAYRQRVQAGAPQAPDSQRLP